MNDHISSRSQVKTRMMSNQISNCEATTETAEAKKWAKSSKSRPLEGMTRNDHLYIGISMREMQDNGKLYDEGTSYTTRI